ncbi:1,3-beta-glucanosyltransferase [Desmophyllum pertusum]|uniref:1,3-beta-glucanosyltransferase n=1 Tax=Desmophyllum pertusum TaxID=174260 RepID=A0A9W9ZD22_9CNID|nr:1,3-beta-glucanosyltransferase [Desmophyllum pertusum]
MGEEGKDQLDFTTKIAERSEQDLQPLKEDLAEWMSRVLQEEIRAENIMDCLDNDVARVAADYGIEPPKLIKLEKEIDDEIAAEEEKKPDLKPAKKEKKISKATSIDAEVARLAAKYNVRIERIKEGRYIVDGKINIFVRILRNHVMVRVGGGWDTLEHFISRHDPNKIGRIMTSTPQSCTHHHHPHPHQITEVPCSAST